MQLFIWDLIYRQKKPGEKLKKAFRLKWLEFCETRSKKSNLDMFNFYVDLHGHEMIIEVDKATTCSRKSKPVDHKQKYKKRKDLSKSRVSTEKQFEDFRRKKRKLILEFSKNPVEHKGPKAFD